MNNDRNDNWTGQWAKNKLQENKDVTSIKLTNPNLLEIAYKHNGKYKVATMDLPEISRLDLNKLLNGENISFVLNITPGPYISGDALKFSSERGFSIGGMGDLLRALSEKNLANYVPPDARFILRGLRQHRKVSGAERLDSLRIEIEMITYSNIIILVLSDYELTADSFRSAMERVPDFDAVLASNPNREPTNECLEAVASTGKKIFTWKELFKELNSPWK